MKQLKFIIIYDDLWDGRRLRDYLISWIPNNTIYDPEGLTFTSREHFIDANYRIQHTDGLGELTIFNTRCAAEEYAQTHLSAASKWDEVTKSGWRVIPTLIDLDDEWKNIQSKI